MTLYRPIGEKEKLLIEASNYCAFPPRLPHQPIFYPVLNEQYATEIAQRWNTKDPNSNYTGYVTRFEIEDTYISQYEIHTVGDHYHQEYWIPAEELENFNLHLLGPIQIISKFTA